MLKPKKNPQQREERIIQTPQTKSCCDPNESGDRKTQVNKYVKQKQRIWSSMNAGIEIL